MKVNPNAPAFPESVGVGPTGLIVTSAHTEAPGLTVREYFAAKAMQGMLAGVWTDDDMAEYDDDAAAFAEHKAIVAKACAGYADALIAELNKENSND